MYKIIHISILTILVLLIGVVGPITPTAEAVTSSDWNPARIIDDSIFFNPNSMTTQEIQNFLNAKVPVCDTNGQKMYNQSQTRAQWAAANGRPQPPYTCLKDFTQNIPGISPDAYCGGSVGAGTKSAATIIKEVALACGINPQVILVTLQKEQSLITDDWPWPVQYTKATGMGCPDSSLGVDVDANQNGCYDDYEGLFKQIYYGARQFQRYVKQPGVFNYAKGRNSYVAYQANNAGCGGTNLTPQSNATAALYNYTPYQPNAAALNNLYGTGDGCSAYGNRNFWRMFNDWFGSTVELNPTAFISNLPVTIVSPPPANPAVGQEISYTVSFKNNFSFDLSLDGLVAVGRSGSPTSGGNKDFGWQGQTTIPAGTSRQFTFTTKVVEPGLIYVWPAVLYQGTYVQYNNWGSTINARTPNLTLSQPLTMNPTTVYEGQNATFSATVKNNETQPIHYDALGIPVKYSDNQNYDATWVGPGVIQPGAEVVLSGTRKIDKSGTFTYWVSNNLAGKYSTIGSVNKFTSVKASPNFSVSGLTLTNSSPVQGETLGVSFSMTNNLPIPITVDAIGVIGRFGSFTGANRDIDWKGPVTFAAGETKTFTGYTRKITDIGTHYYWIGVFNGGTYMQYNNWGSTVISREPNFSVSGLNFTNTSPVHGENLGVSFSVTNNLQTPVTVDAVGVVGRFGSLTGSNRDIDWKGPVTFAAGETKAFTDYTRTISDVGTHYYWIGIFNSGKYLQYNNWGSTIVSRAP